MAYTDKLRVVYGDYTLGVHGEGFDYIFSYAQGGLESIVKNGYEWLYRCPKPTFWRALTDNDRGSKFHIKSGSWLSADMFIDCKGIQVIMDGKEQKPYAPDNNSYGGDVYADEIIVKYTYETITTPATTVLVSYSVDASGKIRVDVHYNGVQGLPEFPVFGMRFIMPTLADKYLYKGLSGETYPDRKAGAQEGVYEIGDLSLTQYLVPQECGMRMDTEWLEIMIPLVGEVKELKYVKKFVVETADAEIAASGIELEYEVGTMIEIPRAALTADEIAKEADFFCFGTNDLTQMTFGFSRNDAGKFLDAYYDAKIYENDPFAKLDSKIG